jgi:two-component system, LuxR family, response regulator FixJ
VTDGQDCRIIIVDDEAAVRDSLDALLSAKGYRCEAFQDAETFLSAHQPAHAAIILMDFSLGAISGLQAIRQVRAAGDTRPIIMVTAHGDIDLAVEAMRAGASDFIEKPWDKDALFHAIERVAENARSAAHRAEIRQQAVDAINSFTPRERDVFDQLITGASNKLVARALDLSPRTVEFYRAKVLEKARATSIAELVRLAFMAKGAEI